AGIGSGDTRRIVRALEVGELTGRPFTAFLPRPHLHDPSTVQLGLRLDRAVLHERIAARVHRMVEQGLLAEVRALRAQGLDAGRTARRAIGYEQALAVLDGAMSCQQAIEETIAGTRRLVRKQDTWFRRDQRVHWLEADAGEVLVDQAVARIGAAVTARGAQQPEARGMSVGSDLTEGHGTENDFVVVDDPDGLLDLDATAVTALADRRTGIGGDGVIRAVRSHRAGIDAPGDAPEWFMDYRNADGSIAEMCGNGVRVLAA